MDTADPVALTRALIRCPTVTPAAEPALDLLEERLTALGFTCRRLRFEGDASASGCAWMTGPHSCINCSAW